MDSSNAFTRYADWIEKKVAGKPVPVQAFLNDTYSGGISVLDELYGIPTGKLSIASRIDAKYEDLYRMYESLIKTAAKKPDQFVHTFYEEMVKTGRYIRENSLYTEFGELYCLLKHVQSDFLDKGDRARATVTRAYGSLMQENYHYLTPAEYDMERLVCGRSTDGEPLYCDRYCPEAAEIQELMFDEVLDLQENGQPIDTDALTKKYAEEYGCGDIRTEDDLGEARDCAYFRSEQILNLLPYINEYTYDMLPDAEYIYDMDLTPLEMLELNDMDVDALTGSPDARSRTLPTNGIRYDFSYSPRIPAQNQIQSLYMKEVIHNGRIVVLYKLRFRGQDLCGYLNRRDRALYISFSADGSVGEQEHTERLLRIILYLYDAATTPGGWQMTRDFGKYFCAAVSLQGKNRYPISVTAHPWAGNSGTPIQTGGNPRKRPGKRMPVTGRRGPSRAISGNWPPGRPRQRSRPPGQRSWGSPWRMTKSMRSRSCNSPTDRRGHAAICRQGRKSRVSAARAEMPAAPGSDPPPGRDHDGTGI